MSTEPIQFDINGEVIHPRRSPVESLLAQDTIRHAHTTPWDDLARDMGGVMVTTDMGTTAGPGPAISDIAVIGGDLHVRIGGSRRWEPVRHMGRAEAGLPSYAAGDNYATPWNHGNRPVRIAAADTAYDLDRMRRAELAAELAARPTQPMPTPTGEFLAAADRIRTAGMTATAITQTLPDNLPDLPPPTGDYPPPPSPRRGRTAEERARDAAAAERRRLSDPPHDEPSPSLDAIYQDSLVQPGDAALYNPPQTWAEVVTPTEPPL